MVPKWLKGGAEGLKIQNIKTLFSTKKLLLRNSEFILITFFNKSIRLWFGSVVSDGADGTIIAKSQTNGFIEKSY